MRKLRKDLESVADMMERLSMPIPETGCYEWLGKIGTGGYAYIAYREDGKRYHRKAATVALELAGRPRPEGLEVSHTCDNRTCVNPDHLLWETHSENIRRRGPWRVVEDCQHCGKPKVYMAHWAKPGWYCEDTNRKWHRKLLRH